MNKIIDDSQLRALTGHRIELVCIWQFGFNLHTSRENFPFQVTGVSFIRSDDGTVFQISTGGKHDEPFWADATRLVDLLEQEITGATPCPDSWGCEIAFENGLTLVVRTDSPFEDLQLGDAYF